MRFLTNRSNTLTHLHKRCFKCFMTFLWPIFMDFIGMKKHVIIRIIVSLLFLFLSATFHFSFAYIYFQPALYAQTPAVFTYLLSNELICMRRAQTVQEAKLSSFFPFLCILSFKSSHPSVRLNSLLLKVPVTDFDHISTHRSEDVPYIEDLYENWDLSQLTFSKSIQNQIETVVNLMVNIDF